MIHNTLRGLMGLGLFVSEIHKIAETGFNLMNCGYLALFILTGWVVFSWIWATQQELDILFEGLDPENYEPLGSLKETILILGLALLLVGLLFASRNPLIYAILFFIYNFVDLLAGKYFRLELSKILEKSKTRAETVLDDPRHAQKATLYLKGLDVLEKYFIKRPHSQRILLTLFFALIGLLASLRWFLTKEPLLGFFIYVLFILTLFISTVRIWRWRIIRDECLRPVRAELNELHRTNKKKESGTES